MEWIEDHEMSEERQDLSKRGERIVKAADFKLANPDNERKGNGWKEYHYMQSIEQLECEVGEFIQQVIDIEMTLLTKGTVRESQKSNLLLEAGDVKNWLRMICDKYGALRE